MIKLEKPKKCSCGAIHNVIPKEDVKISPIETGFPGYWWNCKCGSTLYYPTVPKEQLYGDVSNDERSESGFGC